MKELFFRQKGIFLIYLIAVISISSLILSVVVPAIYQSLNGTRKIKNDAMSISAIATSSKWIYDDGMIAENTPDLADGASAQNHITFYWTKWAASQSEVHTSAYQLNGTNLVRTHDGISNIVARNITEILFSRSGRLVTIQITSTVEPNSIQRTYQVCLRPVL
ncbi:MAG: hypothetical protein NTV30_03625 [Chloroflexi bacterium]|nr:hypothetical protein [Chloroflexota bacterium]